VFISEAGQLVKMYAHKRNFNVERGNKKAPLELTLNKGALYKIPGSDLLSRSER
jgi:hypothetical protein